MKYLAVDYGAKRTGIAVSDEGGRMAFARKTLIMTTKERFWLEFLKTLETERPQAIVVGMPRTADGAETLIVRQVRNFLASLRRRTELPVFVMEETLSSFEAQTLLAESAAGKKNAASRAGLDAAAAARILESFLKLPEHKRMPA